MRYAIVVKNVTDQMYINVHGIVLGEKIKRNSLFSFLDCRNSLNGRLCASNTVTNGFEYTFIIPLEWCMELTEQEYKIFKRLEK
jgi:hypothetical protein